MKKLRLVPWLTLSLATLAQAASPLPTAKPEEVGFSSDRLRRIGAHVEQLQRDNKIAGAVTVVARRGRLVQFEAYGFADVEGKRAMRTDDIFALASMTKPIATVGVLMLVEEGRLLLSDPVEKFLPAFRGMKVAQPQSSAPNGYELVAVERSITIHDLLTHRAGFPGQPSSNRPAVTLRREGLKPSTPESTLADFADNLARLPLDNHPGTEWRYGDSTTLLGRVIEVAAGKTLDVFLRERVFEPLGMTDTAFGVPPEKIGRLASRYSRSPEAQLVKSSPLPTSTRFFSAGGGLFSTASDYLRFCQMLLNGGELDGRRLLGRKSVELMSAVHVEQIPLGFLRGQGFGLGVAVQLARGDSGLLGSAGTYGWSGAYNTYFRIDPQEKLTFAIFVQQSPANNLEIQYGFQNLVMQALTD